MAMFSVIGYSQVTITQNSSLLKEPSLTSKVIATAFDGDPVTLIEHTGKFWKVDYQKKTGYIHEICLSNYIAPSKKEQDKSNVVEQIQEKPQSVTDKTVPEKTGVSQSTQAQTKDRIIWDKQAKVYYQNNKPLPPKVLSDMLLANPESADVMKLANKNIKIATISACGGLVLLVADLIPLWLSLDDIGIAMGFIGLAGVVGSLPIAIVGRVQQRMAIKAYNSSYKGPDNTMRLDLGVTKNGVGLVFSF